LLFGIIPAIVQSVVDDAAIQFAQVTITQPTDSSFRMYAKGKLTNTSPFTANIQETHLDIYVNDKKLGSFIMPPLTAQSNGDTDLVIDTTIKVESASVFNEFSEILINSPSVVWRVVGLSSINAIGMTFQNVNFDKDVEISAFNSLPDVTIVVFDLSESTPTEIVVVMSVRVTNPSIVSMIPLGDLQMEMEYKGAFMGYLAAPNVSMYTQDNVMSMRGQLDPEDLVLAGELMSRYLTGQMSDVMARGSENATNIGLYLSALQAMKLNTRLVANETLLVTDLIINNLTMILESETQLALNGYVYIEVLNPLGNASKITLSDVSLDVDLLTSGGLITARMQAVSVTMTQVGELSYVIQLLSTTTVQPDNFAQFVNDFVFMNETSITMQGTTNVNATLPIGNVDLSGLKVVNSAAILGLDGLQPGTIVVKDVEIVGGYAAGIYMALTLAVYNPSNVNLQLGAVSMDLFFNDTYIGQTTVPEFNIAMGAWTELSGRAVYQHPGEVPGRAFLSQFLAGANQSLALTGSANASAYSFLLPSFQALQTSTLLPGQTSKLVTYAQLLLNWDFSIGTKLTINNPFNTTLWINKINNVIYFKGNTLGTLTANLLANPIMLNPKSVVTTQKLAVSLSGFDISLLGALGGTVSLSVTGPLDVSIDGQFNTTIDFSVVNLPAGFASA
jgi:LEA14-like dessication related protein